jgi:hypothetical protein
MTALLAPTQSNIMKTLRTFILSVVPSGVAVVDGQDNRVSEPAGSDFVVMTPIRRDRLSTNVDTYVDALFTGSIAGNILTVSAVSFGAIKIGSPVLGSGVMANTSVTALGSGSGGTGTYTINNPQNLGSRPIACGVAAILQPTRVIVQLDVHGPGSNDNAQIIATALRDEYAYESFKASGFDVTPLYAEDPRQIPFLNDQQQYETRWVIEAAMQANQVVTVPQEFAGVVTVLTKSIEEAFPAS